MGKCKEICIISIACLLCTVDVTTSQEVGYENPACDGKTVIVHLFEWKWNDVALECERFLAPAGFCGVQVSPPNEHAVFTDASNPYPWWQRYQPVSYKLHSRSGTEEEFINMVHRCNAVGVRIFVDAVINHMTGLGTSGTGSAGSDYNADEKDYPGVPYTEDNFTPRAMCPSDSGSVDNYKDPDNVRNCYLVGLVDLYGATEYVRETIAGYFNHLISMGVAGFRIDASKHMWPEDLQAIMNLTKDLNEEKGFPASTRPFFFHEIVDRHDGEAVTLQQYYGLGRVTEFSYSDNIAAGIHSFDKLEYVYNPESNMSEPDKALIFVDNQDSQRSSPISDAVLTFKQPHEYRLGVAFTLAQSYGFTRIMSSYDFGKDTNAGPPHYSNYSTADVIINDQNQCEGGWVCEHRWLSIHKMVQFRNAVAGSGSWDNYYCDGNAVAFSRGDKGFFAMVKNGTLSKVFKTGLVEGTYQDLISCKSVIVERNSEVEISITNEDEPIFAICQGCKCSDVPKTTEASLIDIGVTTESPAPPIIRGIHRTVIFIRKDTIPDQDVFIKGGISIREGCTNETKTDPCAIAMKTYSLGDKTFYAKYNSWRVNDTKLDWHGPEPTQGKYEREPAYATPLGWTTDDQSKGPEGGYQPLNGWGPNYWMIDMDLDCFECEGGWFEFQAYMTHKINDIGELEETIDQKSTCDGTAGGPRPYSSKYHMAKCGYINKFTFDDNYCSIYTFPQNGDSK